ncbi:MAG: hypothetical protein IPO60_18095 [Flavobacteriales bacterium]|nr:hypothetical protein [Flavobacteriales bacterium]
MPLLSHPFRAYLRHLRHAGNRHDVHSPFVFTLVDQVLRKRPPGTEFGDIEKLRSKLLSDRRMIIFDRCLANTTTPSSSSTTSIGARAWRKAQVAGKGASKVTVTIDLFHFGIVFARSSSGRISC